MEKTVNLRHLSGLMEVDIDAMRAKGAFDALPYTVVQIAPSGVATLTWPVRRWWN